MLGIDSDPRIVQDWSDRLTQVVEADATDTEALRQLGVQDFARAVVGIGTNLEASVLTVLTLTEVGVPEIWAKATSVKHGKILSSVGARHVVYPEAEMGERVAHLITGRMLDYIEFDDGFAIAKVRAPQEAVGRTLADIGLRSKWGVTVVGRQTAGPGLHVRATRRPSSPQGCILIVAGDTAKVEQFAGRDLDRLRRTRAAARPALVFVFFGVGVLVAGVFDALRRLRLFIGGRRRGNDDRAEDLGLALVAVEGEDQRQRVVDPVAAAQASPSPSGPGAVRCRSWRAAPACGPSG